MQLSSDINEIKGIGPVLVKLYNRLGIETAEDLINFYPRRYEDYSQLSLIAKLSPGPVSFKAKINNLSGRYSKRRLHITEAIASDSSGSVRLIWFNQPYRKTSIKLDHEYFVSGTYELSQSRFSLINPSLELVSDMPLNTARILPIYKETKGLDSRQIRKAISSIRPLFKTIPETLPSWLINDHKFLSRSNAIELLQLPKSQADITSAKHRLAFEELFSVNLASQLNALAIKQQKTIKIKFNEDLAKIFVANLPFKLTNDQRIIAWQILKDLQKPEPMNRLIEGDVGSGKTVIATLVAAQVMSDNYQVAFMAPTELLAKQHATTIKKLLKNSKMDNQAVLLIGSMTSKEKQLVKQTIQTGQARLIIGTHAIIQEAIDYSKLALVVIDEQHRFGVQQRNKLMQKAGHLPHVLSLSATPIPRTLALTLYNELSISVLKEKPKARLPITSKLVWPSEQDSVFADIKDRLKNKQQAYIVCPTIDKSEVLDVKSASDVYEQLKAYEFKDFKVGLMHGRQNSIDNNLIMQEFIEGKIDVLVATTMIEVGVDVANATNMIIMSPERFGLAQLHQLRGRVGRGKLQSYFYMFLDSSDPPSPRLRSVISYNDGFKLAELDLRIRGPGAIYGTLQHGRFDFKVANFSDSELIIEAKQAATAFIDKKESLLKYKELSQNVRNYQSVINLN